MPSKSLSRAIGYAALSLALAGPALAQSSRSPMAPPPPPPPPVATQPAQPAADMQAVLDAMTALGAKPTETLTPEVARAQPSAADAANNVLLHRGQPLGDPSVVTKDVPYGSDPLQYARIYKPAAAAMQPGVAPMPVIVYYHGGGWVIANVGTYDAAPRFLSGKLNAIVVSVEYRHAPEAKFPAQHDDAAAAYRWVLANAASWGGDTRRLALAGESAGGNLAVATAIYARDNRLPMPVHILSVYPIANSSMTTPSKIDSANAKPLGTAGLAWFAYYTDRSRADQQDPRINLVSADLRGLPPTTIVNAQIDPLRSDGETLAQAMRSAGDQVEQRTFPGVTHEFFGMGKVVATAMQAESYAAGRLQAAFAGAGRR